MQGRTGKGGPDPVQLSCIYFSGSCQLHRFIELIRENHVDLQGKYASQITTSKHFYDVTAHAFIRENCMDLGMRWLNGLSADMSDLLNKKGQKEAQDYFRFII